MRGLIRTLTRMLVRMQVVDLALVAAVCIGAAFAVARSRELAMVATAVAATTPGQGHADGPQPREQGLRASRSPFRLGREMPHVRFGETAPVPVPVAPPPPRAMPALVLKATAGGPPWTAVLAGLPGTRGDHVVRPGDDHDGIRVREISATHVTLTMMDTTWTLLLSPEVP